MTTKEHLDNFKMILRKFDFPLYREWAILKLEIYYTQEKSNKLNEVNYVKEKMRKYDLEKISEVELIYDILNNASNKEKIRLEVELTCDIIMYSHNTLFSKYKNNIQIAFCIEAYCQLLDEIDIVEFMRSTGYERD